MIITSNHLNKLDSTFKFLQTEFYKENQQLVVTAKMNSNREIESTTCLNLLEHDLAKMQSFSRKYMADLLNKCKDEFQSNLFRLSELNELRYLERYKQEFYSICLKCDLHRFYFDLRVNGVKYLELDTEHRGIIDTYIEEISNLAYQWTYFLHIIEREIRQHRPQNEITVPPRGIELREDLIFNILYVYDFDNTEEEKPEITDDDIQYLEFIETEVKNNNWFEFSDGALKQFLCGKYKEERDGIIEWLYSGNKKSNTSPSIIHLAMFSLVLFTRNTLFNLDTNEKITQYISSSILLDKKHKEFDKSVISKARNYLIKHNITDLETLTKHLGH